MQAIRALLAQWAAEAAAPPAEVESALARVALLRPYLRDWLEARAELDPDLTRVLFAIASWIAPSTRLAQLPALQASLSDALDRPEATALADAAFAKLRSSAGLFDPASPTPSAEALETWRQRFERWPRCLERIFWLDLGAAEALALAESLGGSPYPSPERADLT